MTWPKDAAVTHGMSKTPTWRSWTKMRGRCNDPKNNRYHRYGGRGIKVCDRWLDSFENFLADIGEHPQGMTLDRKDENKDYTPENCRWATAETQARGAKRMIEFNGETRCVKDWASHYGLKLSTLTQRFRYGWPVEKAFTTPV